MAEIGTWVRIKQVVFEAAYRADKLPEETRAVPFITWVKGTLTADAVPGQTVTVRTKSGRFVSGELVEVNPAYELNYGGYVPQLQYIGDSAREIIFGGGRENE